MKGKNVALERRERRDSSPRFFTALARVFSSPGERERDRQREREREREMAASACVASAAVARAVPRPVKAAGSKHLRGRIQGASHATRLGGRGVVLAASAGDSAFVVDPEVVRQPRPEYIPSRIDDENYVRVFDTTLRDGEQSPGASESPPHENRYTHAFRAWLAATEKKPRT